MYPFLSDWDSGSQFSSNSSHDLVLNLLKSNLATESFS